METSPNTPSGPYQLEMWTSSAAELPASPTQSQESEKDWMIRAANSLLPLQDWLNEFVPSGFSGKTSRASYPAAGVLISQPSKILWSKSGISSPGECLTQDISERPSVVKESFLSDILETGDLPQRYYLSPTACAGILKRGERRKKNIPPVLKMALKAVAESESSDHTLTQTPLLP
jgi:hypothetical protein